MESVAFTFNGIDTLTAVITNAVPARTYVLTAQGPGGGFASDDIQIAVSTTLTLQVTDVALDSAFPTFEAEVFNLVTSEQFGSTIFRTNGTPQQYPSASAWVYDGLSTIEVTLVVPTGSDYCLYARGEFPSEDDCPGEAGTGVSQTFSLTITPSPPTGRFAVTLSSDGDYVPYSTRLFDGGVADAGVPGNPEVATQYQRIYGWRVNISDDALETLDPVLTSPQDGAS